MLALQKPVLYLIVLLSAATEYTKHLGSIMISYIFLPKVPSCSTNIEPYSLSRRSSYLGTRYPLPFKGRETGNQKHCSSCSASHAKSGAKLHIKSPASTCHFISWSYIKVLKSICSWFIVQLNYLGTMLMSYGGLVEQISLSQFSQI